MSEDRILLPGPGLARGRHGPRHRGGGARGDGRSSSAAARRPGSTSCGSASRRRRRSSSTPRCSSRRSSRRASRCSPPCAPRHRAGLRGRPLGRRVRGAGRAQAMTVEEAIALVRERGLAMAEAAAPAPRLDGRDPRARGRDRREALPADPRRLAGELQLPGPDRRLGREPGRRRVLRAARSGRPPRRQAESLGRVPQPARRARRRAPAAGDRAGPVPGADGAVHVDRHGADRVGAADWARCSSTS